MTPFRLLQSQQTKVAMDLYKAIQELHAEKLRLTQVIASLENLLAGGDGNVPTVNGTKRRGRKSMDPGERQEVSERMKKYWAARRSARAAVGQ